MFRHGLREILHKKHNLPNFAKTADTFAHIYCEKTVHVRDNSFAGSSNESIANILVKKLAFYDLRFSRWNFAQIMKRAWPFSPCSPIFFNLLPRYYVI